MKSYWRDKFHRKGRKQQTEDEALPTYPFRRGTRRRAPNPYQPANWRDLYAVGAPPSSIRTERGTTATFTDHAVELYPECNVHALPADLQDHLETRVHSKIDRKGKETATPFQNSMGGCSNSPGPSLIYETAVHKQKRRLSCTTKGGHHELEPINASIYATLLGPSENWLPTCKELVDDVYVYVRSTCTKRNLLHQHHGSAENC